MSFWKEVDELVEKGKDLAKANIKVPAKELVDLREKVNGLEDEIKKKTDQLEELNQVVKESDNSHAEFKLNNEQEASKLKSQIKGLEEQLKGKDAEMQNAGAQINQFQEGIQGMQQSIAQKDAELEQLRAQLAALNSDANAAKQMQEQIRAQMEAQTQQMQAQMQQQMQQMEAQVTAKRKEVDDSMAEMQEQKKAMEREIELAKVAAGDIVQAKDMEISDLKGKIGLMQTEIQQAKTQAANPEELAKKDQEIQVIHQQLATASAQVQSLQGQIQQMQSSAISQEDYQAVSDQNKALQSDITNFGQTIAGLKNQIGQLEMMCGEKDRKIKELEEPRSVMAPSLAGASAGRGHAQPAQHMAEPAMGASSGAAAQPQMSMGGGGARKQCPQCGASGFAIREVEDKTRPIAYWPKTIFAKKNVCSKCSYEF